ncbi:MAG: organomercurial lyase [Micromonosporaceae bacterium]
MADELLATDGLMDRRDPYLSVALFRLLAEGAPVSPVRLATRAGRSLDRAGEWLRAANNAVLDQHGDVVAYHGLDLRPTRHQLEVADRILYAWCAADALGMPTLLGSPVGVRSSDPVGGGTVRLSLDADQVREVEPGSAVLSMVRPSSAAGMLEQDEVSGALAVCGPINLFTSLESGRRFAEQAGSIVLMTVDQGMELLHRLVRSAFGPALAR